ncbi:MAG: prephenate dehydratase [Phycisphaeraceae bacterium]|nr:prephenate dehydratase [Phycisphaeraceae bacterium]
MPEKTPSNEVETLLAPLRARIDQLDRQLVDLLNQRAQIVIEVGKVKQRDNTPVYAPDREQRVLDQVRSYNQGPLPDACVEAIWRELMSGSFALERPLRIGYLGPPGTFSHLAARRKFGASVEYDGVVDIPAVFEEVTRGHIDLGVVPIENSTEGGINATLDAFLDSPLRICAEVIITIHHNLLSRIPLDQIKKVYSHPQPLAQCRRWLSAQLNHVDRIATASTTRAAELAAQESEAAAIGSSLAAELYGLNILFANIEDNPNNVTRFLVISKQSPKPTGDDKTSITFTTAHKAGALSEVLDVFRDHNLNLTHIDKRPSQRVNWEYYFFIDCEGHELDPHVARAIEAARKHCLQLKVLGSFPRAKDVL